MALADSMDRVGQAIIQAHDARTSEVQTIRRDTQRYLADERAAHRAMAEQQRRDLRAAMAEAHRRATEDLRERQTYLATLRRTTATTIHDHTTARHAMARAQRQRLHADHTQMRANVAQFRKEQQTEQRALAQSWQRLSRTMQQRRGASRATSASKSKTTDAGFALQRMPTNPTP